MGKTKVAVVGSTTIDIVLPLPKLPQKGETILGGDYVLSFGGKGANQAIAALRQDCDVIFISRVGNDYYGKLQLDHLEQEGLSTKFIVRDNTIPSAIAIVLIDRFGSNMISVAPGTNMKLTTNDIQTAKSEISEANVLLVQLSVSYDAVIEAISIAKQSGTITIMDPSPAQYFDKKFLKFVNVLTPNKGELEQIVGKQLRNTKEIICAAKSLLLGENIIIVTLGEMGVCVVTASDNFYIPAFSVQTIDTTGAGDAFNGSLASVYLQEALIDAIKFSCAAGALATTKIGAQSALPSKQDVIDFINNVGI